MSLVGTRPPTVDEWEKYELHHRARLATKPGLTGMWQVSGRSNITDFEEVVRLDIYAGILCGKRFTKVRDLFFRKIKRIGNLFDNNKQLYCFPDNGHGFR